MKVHPLRKYSNPDLSDFVIHFVGRSYPPNRDVPSEILTMSAQGRLFTGILKSGEIRAFPVFFGGDHSVICFTECTPAGVETLVREGRYKPWGIAFTKDFVFEKGGGPAFYVRGDEWSDIEKAQLPSRIRARCTKLWPGAEPETVAEALDLRLKVAAEWSHEREWRVLGIGDPPGFQFSPGDVAFLVVGDWESANRTYRNVVINRDGEIDDREGVWLT